MVHYCTSLEAKRMSLAAYKINKNGEGGIRTPVGFPQNAFRVRQA